MRLFYVEPMLSTQAGVRADYSKIVFTADKAKAIATFDEISKEDPYVGCNIFICDDAEEAFHILATENTRLNTLIHSYNNFRKASIMELLSKAE